MDTNPESQLVDGLLSAQASFTDEQFHRLLDALPVAAYTCDNSGLITYFNSPAERLWGKTPRLNHPDDRWCGSFRLYTTSGELVRHDECWMARAIQLDRSFNQQSIIVETPSGERRQVLAHANPIHDHQGRLAGAVNLLVDISDQIRSAESLIASEARYRTLVEATSSIVWVVDDVGQFTHSQPSWERFTGLAGSSQIGTGWLESIHPLDRDHLMAAFEVARRTNETFRVSGRIWSIASDRWHDFDMKAVPVRKNTDSGREWIGVLADVTAHKLAKARNKRYSHIFEDSLNEIFVFDSSSLKFVQANSAAQRNLGYTLAELRQLTPLDIKPRMTQRQFEALTQPLVDHVKPIQVFETVHRRKDGSLYDVEVHLQLTESDGESNFVAIILDVTHRHQTEKRLNYFSRIFEDSINEIYVFDADTLCFLQVNGAAQRNLGYSMAELAELTPVDIKPQVTSRMFNELIAPLRRGTQSLVVFETVHQRKDGSLYDVEVHLQLLQGDGESRFVAIILDVSERKRSNRLLTYQASHDSLTGLINRREFERRASQILDDSRRSGTPHVLCFLDLDQFKVVNDTCGHSAGDEMLRQISAVVEKLVRRNDTLARLGGDEFGVFMERCSIDEATRVATAMRDAIQEFQFYWEGLSFKVGVSIGLVPIVDSFARFSDILKEADTACYLAKEAGRNRIHVFRADDTEVVRRKGEMQWVSRLHRALDENRFFLHAQAIVPTDPAQPLNYEFLTRMYDDDGNVVPPNAFLPAAERYNLASRFDHWVIKNAIGVMENNPDFVASVGHLAINLSGQSMQNLEILSYIIGLIELAGIDGSKLCFEITETAAIANLNVATRFIESLRKYNCQFALDDFGSGFSSFAYLKHLPVDYIKIDGLFVKDIVKDPINFAMVKSINDIGRAMGLKTIAEHVEDDEIRARLTEIGVDYLQGFGIERPRPLANILGRSDASVARVRYRSP